ncbi:MAG: hypothetical protein AAF733_10875 [Verrucomicrobiota bacterium]
MNSVFKDLLVILDQEDVRYLVVGGYAVIFHSQPRYTRDLNIWLEPTAENAGKIMRAFALFGISTFGLDQSDFESEGTQLNIGMPPVAIDFLTSLPGVAFDQAWKNRETVVMKGTPIQYLSKTDLIAAKREAGRAIDLADIEELERLD